MFTTSKKPAYFFHATGIKMLASGRGPTRLRLQQDINELLERRIRAFVYFIHLYRADGMLDDQYRVVGGAERFLLGFCQRIESMGNQRHREPAALLQHDRVVDTPRRARPSISEAAQDEIRLCRQILQILFGRPLLRRQFTPADHVRHTVTFHQ